MTLLSFISLILCYNHPIHFYSYSFSSYPLEKLKIKNILFLPLFIPPLPLFLFLKKILFIYLLLVALGLCWCAQLSPVAENREYSLVARCVGFWLRWLLLLWSTGSRAHSFSSCAPRVESTGSMVAAQGLTLWHVESSQTRDWTLVSCIGRSLLYQWATRETSLFLS